MKKRFNTKLIPTIPLMFLVMALMAAMASQPGCSDNQPGSDAPVSIEEGGGGADNEAPAPCEPVPVEAASEEEEVVAANEELFITESVDGGVAITGWKQDVELPSELVIPATIEGKNVVEIGKEAFSNCVSLTSVVIPKGVTEIGGYAFINCSSLTSVVIPAGVTNIGEVAFARSSAKVEVDPKNAFYSSVDGVLFDKDKKTLAHVPTNVSVETYSIPDGVTNIGVCAFADCKSLTSVVIPESVKEIGSNAFEGCSALTSVVIPDELEKIDGIAFKGCESLTSVVIPDGVTNIGGSTFEGCSSLTSVVIPESVDNIGYNAFYKCSALESIAIPEVVTHIGNSAFLGCSSLTSVVIPRGVESIAESAFQECPAKLRVYKGSCAEKWARDNNREYEIIEEGGDGEAENGAVDSPEEAEEAETPNDEPMPVEDGADYVASYPACAPIPAEADTRVAPCAPFWMDTTPEVFFITENVDGGVAITGYKQDVDLPVVPDGLFLPPIVIPSQIGGKPVVKIDTNAFSDCSSIMSVVIPESVLSIEDGSFEGYPAKILVFKDSYAEKWARENNLEYEIIEKGGNGANNEGVAPCEPIPAGEPVPPCVAVPPSSEATTPNDEPKPVEDGSKPSASESVKNELREWTDSTGKYRIKATLAEQEGSNVKLLREDGKRITMPISKLSEEDRNYLSKLTEATPIKSEPNASEPTKNGLREWTDSTGAYRIKATFEKREGSNVKLRREDGKRITMPISKLSDADQDYLTNL